MRRLLAILGLAWAMSAGVCTAAEIDLTSVPRYLPYQAQSVTFFGNHQTKSIFRGSAIVQFDVNDDGQSDLVYASGEYIAARGNSLDGNVTYYQVNLPPAYVSNEAPPRSPSVSLCGDLNGDGHEDVVVLGLSQDKSEWWFWIMDPRDGRVHLKSTLPLGEDVRPDGWDGIYYTVGPIDVTQGGREVRAVVFGCSVGFDKYGRGVLAVDPRDGDILWRYTTGPNPFCFNTRLADLDGDGQSEIVFVGRSPDNLGGEEINGFSDQETRLFVVDRQGQLRWSRFMGKSFGNGDLDIGDMDGDGRPEIVTSAQTTPEIWGELVVWDAQGTALARLAEPLQLQQVKLVKRRDRPNLSVLAATGREVFKEYDWREGALIQRRQAELPGYCRLNYVGDFMAAAGTEIIVSHMGQTLVLDEDLKPLLAVPNEGPNWQTQAEIWQIEAGASIIYWPVKSSPAVILSRAPFAWQRLIPAGAILSALALLATFVWLTRRSKQTNRHLLHETRLNLLDNLELSNHGAIAPLKCVRRLIWHLRALQADLVDVSKVEIRMREAWTEARESALPHLRGIIDRAQLAGAGAGDMGHLTAAVGEMEKQLEAMVQTEFRTADREDIVERLEEAERKADAALLRLRAEVATYFKADIAEVAARVRRARSLDLAEAEVAFQVGFAAAAAGGEAAAGAPPAAVHGLCDPHELEFILDNLVGNAITAMMSSTTRNLGLSWRTADGMVLIDVADTGCGLAEDLWDRALNSRYSSKPSGGQGLPKSLRYLRKYGGSLSILSSVPGRGSTFRVILPLN